MLDGYEYQAPTLERSIAGFKQFPQSGINLEVLAEGIKSGELSSDQQTELSDTCVKGYNQALHACFPRDAFDILRGQNMIAANIPPQENLDLEKEWAEISQLTKINIPQESITTEAAFQHFRQFRLENFPDYESIVQKISLYISELIRRAHKENDSSLLGKVIPTFKLLAYLHKMHRVAHYWCSDEFDAMVRFGVDPDKLEFKYLKKEEVKERFFDEATLV